MPRTSGRASRSKWLPLNSIIVLFRQTRFQRSYPQVSAKNSLRQNPEIFINHLATVRAFPPNRNPLPSPNCRQTKAQFVCFLTSPKRLAADTAYGTGKMLAWLLEKGITPHIPVWERYQRTDGVFPCTDFAYDAERNILPAVTARS